MNQLDLSSPNMFQNPNDSLTCGYCFTLYQSQAELLKHQENRGHRLQVFDRRSRITRRPPRYLDAVVPVIPFGNHAADVGEAVDLSERSIIEDDDQSEDDVEQASESDVADESSFETNESEEDEAVQEQQSLESELIDDLEPTPSTDSEPLTTTSLLSLSIKELLAILPSSSTIESPDRPPILKSMNWGFGRPLIEENMDTSSAHSIMMNTKRLQCTLCNRIYKSPGSGGPFSIGGNIRKHLIRKHQANQAKKRTRQTLIHQPQIVQRLIPGTKESDMFWTYWALSLLEGNISDSFSELPILRDTFQTFLNAQLPHRRKLVEIHSTNDQKMMIAIGEILKNVSSCALSTDTWSSNSMQMYTGLMIHFIDERFRLLCFCLGVFRFSKKGDIAASAINLSNQIRISLSSLPSCSGGRSILDTCTAVTTDAAAVMPATVARLQKKSKLCVSHQLQLLMKELVLSQDHLCILSGLASKIAAHIHRSTKISDSLNRKIIGHVQTRFDSYLHCIESVSLNLGEIKQYLQTVPDAPIELIQAASEFESLQPLAAAIVKILTPIASVSAILGAQYTPTAQSVLICLFSLDKAYRNLMDDTDTEISNQAKYVLSLLSRRFSAFFRDRDYLVASVLCPTVRKRLETDPHGADLVRKGIDLLRSSMMTQQTDDTAQSQSSGSTSSSQVNQPLWLDTLLPLPAQGSALSNVDRELNNFLSADLVPYSDPLHFWAGNFFKYPRIAQEAKALLCYPASSLACERLFSIAGKVVTKERNRLSPERINVMTRSKHNMRALQRIGILKQVFETGRQ